MVGGAYTLTDTMRGAAGLAVETPPTTAPAAVVFTRPRSIWRTTAASVRPPDFRATTLDQVRAVPGVEKAVGSISDEARIVGKDGDVVGTGPYFGVGLDPQAGELSPFRLKEGQLATGRARSSSTPAPPTRRATGSGTRSPSRPVGPERTLEVTGIATFGDVDSIGTATFALFDLPAAQSLFDKQGRYTEILVGGPDSVRAQLSSPCPARCRFRPRRRTTASPSTS